MYITKITHIYYKIEKESKLNYAIYSDWVYTISRNPQELKFSHLTRRWCFNLFTTRFRYRHVTILSSTNQNPTCSYESNISTFRLCILCNILSWETQSQTVLKIVLYTIFVNDHFIDLYLQTDISSMILGRTKIFRIPNLKSEHILSVKTIEKQIIPFPNVLTSIS